MSVEPLDPRQIGIAGGTEDDVRDFIVHDFLIRSGKCPNGHGLMSWDGEMQQCGTCHFICNTRPEIATK